ncbi:MAG: hypothetical protein HOC20_08680 [Chloroflexi bacterium]|nr:hypothetical protein [Chloroflexota bacterium]
MSTTVDMTPAYTQVSICNIGEVTATDVRVTVESDWLVTDFEFDEPRVYSTISTGTPSNTLTIELDRVVCHEEIIIAFTLTPSHQQNDYGTIRLDESNGAPFPVASYFPADQEPNIKINVVAQEGLGSLTDRYVGSAPILVFDPISVGDIVTPVSYSILWPTPGDVEEYTDSDDLIGMSPDDIALVKEGPQYSAGIRWLFVELTTGKSKGERGWIAQYSSYGDPILQSHR